MEFRTVLLDLLLLGMALQILVAIQELDTHAFEIARPNTISQFNSIQFNSNGLCISFVTCFWVSLYVFVCLCISSVTCLWMFLYVFVCLVYIDVC